MHLYRYVISKWRLFASLICVCGISFFLTELYFQRLNLSLTDSGPYPENKWFLKCINQSVEPFLTANYSLSEETFNWWKLLVGDQTKFSQYRKTVDRLYQIVPPTPEPQQWRSCAVVGNSANLIQSHYGPLIDLHNIVMRINRGPTKGYEADVGHRTTHRIMYPESATNLDVSTHLVLFPFKSQDLVWLANALTTGISRKTFTANKDLVMVLNPAFIRYVHDAWLEKKGLYPSTGFLTVILALHICDEVHVFGYGADEHGSWSHYFEKLKDKEFKTGPHPGKKEYQTIQELARIGKLRFYMGNKSGI